MMCLFADLLVQPAACSAGFFWPECVASPDKSCCAGGPAFARAQVSAHARAIVLPLSAPDRDNP